MVRGSPNPRHLGLPARLRKARKLSGLSRKGMVQKVGAGETAARDIETGQRIPTVGMIARLASALSVSAGWLAFGLGEMHTDSPAATCEEMGARLQTARIAREHTKASLARLAELTAPSIAQIENGGQAGVDTIDRLARSLRVSPAWLAYGLGDRELPPRRHSRGASIPAVEAETVGFALSSSLDRRRGASA